MDLLAHFFGGPDLRATWGPTDDRWYESNPGIVTSSGMRVDADQAQKISAWYRGRDILATVLAMLPFPIYQRLPNDGGSEPATDHPLYDLLHDAPNSFLDSFQWRRDKMFHLIDYGWSYDWIVSGARGFVHELHPIDPKLVTPEQIESGPNRGRYLFKVRNAKTGQSTTHTQDEIFYLRGASGKGILEYARSNIGTALATESYAANIFSRGTLNGGVIENPGLLNAEAARRMAVSFATKVGEWHMPKILEQGSKFVPNTMTPEDAQMLLSRKFSIDDMARWLGVPRQMLENSDPSFGNAEQFDQNFITYSMGGWLSLFEFGVNGQLILQPKKYYAEFTRDAIARGKLIDRWNVHVAAVNAGIKSVDEARAKEGLNKRGGKADELREPQNITGKPTAIQSSDPSTKQSATTSDPHIRAIVTETAARLVRKEQMAARGAAVKFAADQAGFAAWAIDFYEKHVALVSQSLHLNDGEAWLYCDSQRDALVADGFAVAETWTPDYLVGVALDAPRPDPKDELLRAAIDRPQPAIHAHTTIDKGAIATTIDARTAFEKGAIATDARTTVESPVTIADGAIRHETHVAAQAVPKVTSVTKKVKRDPSKQLDEVTETHRVIETFDGPQS